MRFPKGAFAISLCTEGPGKLELKNVGLIRYDKQPVTVDFYKIDIHNVFRLFGEISGMNIVIDEGVAGTLTLSLLISWTF